VQSMMSDEFGTSYSCKSIPDGVVLSGGSRGIIVTKIGWDREAKKEDMNETVSSLTCSNHLTQDRTWSSTTRYDCGGIRFLTDC
jgi:hypothetical protein